MIAELLHSFDIMLSELILLITTLTTQWVGLSGLQILIEDGDKLPSKMNGLDFQVSRFAS
jgi:hypothetical protein